MYIAALLKFNVLKRKNQALENALTEKEQEKVSILLEHQNEKQQALQREELEWLAEKIKMFTEEEQKSILASAYAFAEHDLIVTPSIVIQRDLCKTLPHSLSFLFLSNIGSPAVSIFDF